MPEIYVETTPEPLPPQPAVQPKAWYTSKTIWLNVAVAVLAGAEAATGALKPVLGDHGFYTLIVTALPVANMFLRAMTSQPLGKPSQPEAEYLP